MRSFGLLAPGPLGVASRPVPVVGGPLHAASEDVAPGLHLGAGSLGEEIRPAGVASRAFQMRRRGANARGRRSASAAAQTSIRAAAQVRTGGVLASGPLGMARRALPLVGGALHAASRDVAPGLHLGAGPLAEERPWPGLDSRSLQVRRRRGAGAGGGRSDGDAAQTEVRAGAQMRAVRVLESRPMEMGGPPVDLVGRSLRSPAEEIPAAQMPLGARRMEAGGPPRQVDKGPLALPLISPGVPPCLLQFPSS